MQSLAMTITELEKQWLTEIERTPRWLIFLANNIYGILFFLAAVLTVVGFIRVLVRRKAYAKWEEEEEEE